MVQTIVIAGVVLVALGFGVSTLLSYLEHRKYLADSDSRENRDQQNIERWANMQRHRSKDTHGS